MRRATEEEVKKIQLKILDQVANFCDQNGIRYWIDCGTLIGAIRHKGYIPWDDDIDIGMLRPDYDRFSQLFNDRNDHYRFDCPEKTSNAYYPHGKVMDTKTTLYEPNKSGYKSCINVDIFVYDNVPSKEKAAKLYKKREVYRRLHSTKFSRKRPKGNFVRRTIVYTVRFLLKACPNTFFVRKMAKNAQRYKNRETDLVGSFTTYSYMTCEKDVFDSFTTAEFEGKSYMVPGGYDKFLRACYGDYMQLPPEEKRVTHHMYEAYINE